MKFVGVIALVLSMGYINYAQHDAGVGLVGNGPVLSVESDTYDYGTIDQGSNGNCQITIKNTGNETLIISKCQGSCGCTVPKCPEQPILPGDSAVISIHYNTNKTGPITKKITITSNAINSNTESGIGYELYIRGNVKAKPVGETPNVKVSPTIK